MQLTINVSEADFGHELKEIMDSLSPEEKKDIAREVLSKALNEVTDSQRTLREKEEEVFVKIRKGFYNEKDKQQPAEQLRTHYDYKKLMEATKSTKELALEDILKSAVATFKELSTTMVKEDEELKKIWIAATAQIKEDFPKYVHDAVVYYFASQLDSMKNGIMSASMMAQNAAMSIESIRQRLGK